MSSIILINDGSTDNSLQIAEHYVSNHKNIDLINLDKNGGKGVALSSGLKNVSTSHVVIQDADLEYNPNDYLKLLDPLVKKKSKIVYGSRVLGRNKGINFLSIKDFKKNFRIMGNFFLTLFSNLINKQ